MCQEKSTRHVKYSPSEHKKAHFLQRQQGGKGESLEIRTRFHCYKNFAFRVAIGKIQNRINNFVQFYIQKRPKLVKT